ncbi:MAG: DUF748 domain-containing protein, partial [Chromatocurvus sp.]
MLRRTIRIFATVYLVYLAICLLVLLPAMNILAPRVVEQATGRTLSSELILFNPFSLTLELRGMALKAQVDDEPALVAFDRAQANLSSASLWREGIVLDEVLLHGLAVNIRQYGEAEFNFSDLLPEESATEDPPAALPAFTVGRIDFQAEQLDFTDESRSPAYRTHIDDLAFTAHQLSTVRRAGSPYELAMVTENGGRLDWRGELSLATQESAGDIRLQDVDLRPAYRYLAPQLAFVVDSALLDISGNYRASWRDAPSLEVKEGHVALRALQMLPRDPASLPDTSVNLKQIRIDGIAINSEERRVDAQHLGIDALAIAGFSEGDTHSLLPLFMPGGDTAENQDAQAAAGKEADLRADARGDDTWQVSLQRLTTDNTRLRWRSDYTTPELIELSPVRIELRDLAWPSQGASGIDLSLRANDRSDMSVTGDLDVGSGNGDLDYRLQGQPLTWFNPLLAQFLRATINDGELNLDGSVTLDAFAPATIALTSGVNQFALNIVGRDVSALSWNSLTIPDIQVNLPGQSVAVGKIELQGYRGTLHILPDGRLNAQMALPGPDEPAGKTEGAEGAAGAGNSAAVASRDGTGTDWTIRAAGLQLSDARIDFEDESLPIPFRTLIGQLEGDIGPLDSTQPDQRTEITMKGSVDGYAPVTIDGNV